MDNQVTVFKKFLFRKGLKLTTPRREILDAVFSLHEHFDAQQLHAMLKDQKRRISLATVYRTLPLLEEAGLIQHSLRSSSRDVFERIYGHPRHVHWICSCCGWVQETPLDGLKRSLLKEASSLKFRLDEVNIQVNGLCWKCCENENQ
ncbi:MAG TPA: Fur family transcriptional regulator [Candidatus Syntrophosphaera sp.]|jgi:Fur family ferric uptake transcriptional regulator|nr:Fur family transcriptional regulator [Candidatus Syntrophosphaera sp.]HOH48187.1 Fur family transcriptional regulator [Candidatus Syntrophosphaera sp.]HPW38605.1 Fur family transcriptional regulator [Candidatus Syntrophosphaera sp.]HQC47898.1 Fur family transcriptional regulator [Candidatus Syntrophosphaera sp.]